MQKVLWMLVDLQRQELPLAVVDTQEELARLAGSSVSTVSSQISRVKKRNNQQKPVCPSNGRLGRGGMVMIITEIGTPAMLEQLAEECCELAHAALKMSRVLRGENPTPKTWTECLDALTEEIADVELCMDQLNDFVDDFRIETIKDQKWTRWMSRIKDKSGSRSVQDGASGSR